MAAPHAGATLGDKMTWTIPNILTVLRMLAAPLVPLVYLVCDGRPAAIVAFLLFVAAAVTDWFDGYLARKWNQQSKFGTMLDPIADKAMVVLALLVIVGASGMNGWLLFPATIILFRETFVSGLREFLGADAKLLQVTQLAKWKTTAQMVSIALLLLGMAVGGGFFWGLGVLLIWVAAVLTLLTGADYLQKAMPFLRGPK
ncbi:CDP-diacylglycerol--glycerol-3-phosphate 3-phosphatidyltransferase [Ketogulonicigenium robustum]|uniref:CDP-diacylglycerol--glycerol-3-phosphate 3-phosphatidyltransferase n=2 Tax=Ketogulonicigenium robustum TaxID=92947 RepID=A0A1W6NWV5_9RHOB|nr:CDP-diacylglycerol--glycerol-3-phosphate 3-phosphatidyltransferase [Ketogulonicigenium robustum]